MLVQIISANGISVEIFPILSHSVLDSLDYTCIMIQRSQYKWLLNEKFSLSKNFLSITSTLILKVLGWIFSTHCIVKYYVVSENTECNLLQGFRKIRKNAMHGCVRCGVWSRTANHGCLRFQLHCVADISWTVCLTAQAKQFGSKTMLFRLSSIFLFICRWDVIICIGTTSK